MNQLENNSRNRSASPGRSRAKGADRGRSASGRASSRGTSSRNTGHGGSRSSSSYRSGQAGRMNAMQNVRRNSRRHRRKGPDYKWIAIGGVILIVVITCIAMALNGKNSDETGVQATTEAVTETEMKKEVSVDGISITGLSKSQAREVLLKEFPWSMTVSYDSEVYEVNDLMAGKIDSLLNEIYSGEPQESYTLDTAGLEEQIKAEAAACAAKWDKKAKNGSIDSFNAETGKFVFAGEENGFAIDQEKLISHRLWLQRTLMPKLRHPAARWHLRLRRLAQRSSIRPLVPLLQIPHPIKTEIRMSVWRQKLLTALLSSRAMSSPLTEL